MKKYYLLHYMTKGGYVEVMNFLSRYLLFTVIHIFRRNLVNQLLILQDFLVV
jgi:hypothetical protein